MPGSNSNTITDTALLQRMRPCSLEYARLFGKDENDVNDAQIRIAVCGWLNGGKNSRLTALTDYLEPEYLSTNATRATTIIFTILNATRADLLQTVERAEQALFTETAGAQAKALVKAEQRIGYEPDRLQCVLHDSLEAAFQDAKRKMKATLDGITLDTQSAAVQSQIEAASEEVAEFVGTRLNHSVNFELNTTRLNLRDIGDVYSAEIGHARASLGTSDLLPNLVRHCDGIRG